MNPVDRMRGMYNDLVRRRDEVRNQMAIRRSMAELGSSPAWQRLIEQVKAWRGPHEHQLLMGECTPHQQGYSQGYLAALAALVSVDSQDVDALQAAFNDLDGKVREMQTRLGSGVFR